ncbi:MAG: TonB-dependent siderophore receptor [Sphingobium sp.]
MILGGLTRGGDRRGMWAAALLATTMMTGGVWSAPAQAQAVSERAFDIPAQPLPSALTIFGRQSGLQVSVPAALAGGRTSGAVSGTLPPLEALSRLLAGTGLVYRISGDIVTLEPAPRAADGSIELGPVRVEGDGGSATGGLSSFVSRASELPPVHPGGQVARGARIGLMGNVDVMDTPFTITSYTAEMIENQGARTIADVLRNDSSVRFATPTGHPFENFRVRNFAVNQNEMTIDGLYGLAPYSHTPVEMFERVELLRGPSALFVGMAPAGALGGTINLVPKRAGDDALYRGTIDWQSDGLLGARLDLGRRFGDHDEWGLRVNGSFADGDTWLDGQSKQRQFLSVALDYRSGGFKASLDGYYSKEKFTGGTTAGILVRNAALGMPDAPDANLNQFPAAYGRTNNKAAILRTEYAFNDQVAVYANIGVRHGRIAGFFTGTWVSITAADGSGTVAMSGQRMYEENTSADAGVRLNVDTGGITHEMTLQVSRLKMDYGYDASSNGGLTNIYHPVSVAMPVLPGAARKWSDKTFDSIALVDTLSAFDDRVKLTLGLRYQSYKVAPTPDGLTVGGEIAYDKNALTPAVGLVFKPGGGNLSLYASYVQGLSQGARISTDNGYVRNHTFAPYKTEQAEAGVKWTTGTFTNTLAVYQITKPELITFASAGGMDATDGGEKRVRGVEWNSFGEVVQGLRVLGGLVYADSVQTKTQGRLLNGYTAVGSPRWQANLGAEWDVPSTNGLTLTAGMQATSSQWLTSAHTLKLPGWAVFDLGARYAAEISGRRVTLRVNVDNVGNRNYYSGIFREGAAIGTVGAPRTVWAALTTDF